MLQIYFSGNSRPVFTVIFGCLCFIVNLISQHYDINLLLLCLSLRLDKRLVKQWTRNLWRHSRQKSKKDRNVWLWAFWDSPHNILYTDWVCVWVCVCVDVGCTSFVWFHELCISMNASMYVCLCVHVCVCACMCVSMHVCALVCECVRVFMCMWVVFVFHNICIRMY